MAERKEPADKRPEREGPYTKLIALGTVLGLILTYLLLAYTVHWPPDNSPNPGPTSSRPTTPTGTGPQGITPVPQPATGVPAAYQGTWRGNIVYGTTSDQVGMTLGGGAVGAQVGMFTNYTLGCRRSVYLEGGGGRFTCAWSRRQVVPASVLRLYTPVSLQLLAALILLWRIRQRSCQPTRYPMRKRELVP